MAALAQVFIGLNLVQAIQFAIEKWFDSKPTTTATTAPSATTALMEVSREVPADTAFYSTKPTTTATTPPSAATAFMEVSREVPADTAFYSTTPVISAASIPGASTAQQIQ